MLLWVSLNGINKPAKAKPAVKRFVSIRLSGVEQWGSGRIMNRVINVCVCSAL